MNRKASSSSRRLERALDYTSRMWFPVNALLLDKIRANVSSETFDFDQLVNDLKSDFGILTYTIRLLSERLALEQTSVNDLINPCKLFSLAGIEVIKEVVHDDGYLGSHVFSEMSLEQSKRLTEVLVSASAVEVISEAEGIDREAAFVASLLRQLGLTLIAWNYPDAYKDTIQSLDESTTLDQALATKLGFSPSALGTAVIRDWKISDDLKLAISIDDLDSSDENGDGSSGSTAEHIQLVCQVGETLARTTCPEYYPTVDSDWELVQEVITDTLGSKGMGAIKKRIRLNSREYVKVLPELFTNLDNTIGPNQKPNTSEAKRSLSYAHIQLCTPSVQKVLLEFYRTIESSDDPQQHINDLVFRVTPMADFSGGCIFAADTSSMTLVPTLVFGETEGFQIKQVSYHKDSTPSPLVFAFKGEDPIVENVPSASGGYKSIVFAALGTKSRNGVLFLESEKLVTDAVNSQQIYRFHAVKTALEYCMQL